MSVVVIDYNAGNTRSVFYALQRFGVDAEFTGDPDRIRQAGKVIFPGVGEANTTMYFLRSRGLDQLIPALTQPVLGICLGMQLMCAWSEENDTECMGIFDAKVKRFRPDKGQKVPHMGWNTIYDLDQAMFAAEIEEKHVYFVHSYCVEKTPYTSATCNYISPFSAAMHRDNFYATQFHPEKSGPVGASILKKFLSL